MFYNFYPGPSKIYPQVNAYLAEGIASGIFEMNHRSQPFMELLEETLRLFKEKMGVPAEYHVFFTSSATECWEIIAQSLLKGEVQFLYNGAFGKKWMDYTLENPAAKTNYRIKSFRFLTERSPSDFHFEDEPDTICLVQNETSNGTAVSNAELRKLPITPLKCFDVTSSLAGQNLDFSLGDVWFAAVQKCLGLPAGMGVLICSPKAISLAHEINERNHYNSLLFIKENFDRFQTHYTPNILNIFLLNRLMRDLPRVAETHPKLQKRAEELYHFFENETPYKPIVRNPGTRSSTVLALSCSEDKLLVLKKKADEKKITLGNGYGEWKNSSFRIANFPAIEDHEFDYLKAFIKNTPA
jgi:phosphoserine aminotransferase